MPPWQSVGIVAAVIFAAYALIALAYEGRPNSGAALDNIAGVAAWLLLVAAIILYGHGWRNRPGPAERLVTQYLSQSTTISDRLGAPVKVRVPDRIKAAAETDGVQTPVTAIVEGPLGKAQAHLTLARVSGTWEILRAEMVRNGDVIALPSGK